MVLARFSIAKNWSVFWKLVFYCPCASPASMQNKTNKKVRTQSFTWILFYQSNSSVRWQNCRALTHDATFTTVLQQCQVEKGCVSFLPQPAIFRTRKTILESKAYMLLVKVFFQQLQYPPGITKCLIAKLHFHFRTPFQYSRLFQFHVSILKNSHLLVTFLSVVR